MLRYPIGLCLSLAVVLPVTEATEHFVCDCQPGADPDCVVGSDAGAGSELDPWQSYEAARVAFGSLAPGDAIRFCRGGVWTISGGTRWVNTSCEANQRCVVADYSPPWGSGDEARPRLIRTDGSHGFALEDGGDAEHEEGYFFENLDLSSTTGDGNGFFLYNDIDDVEIRNVSIDGFAIGVHLAGSNPCSADPECDGKNDRLVLRNASITNNVSQGWLGGSDGTQILDSTFEGNGTTAVYDHNIYISGSSGGQTHGMVVRNNRLYRSALDGSGVCQAVSLVVHGEHRDLLIEGNEVWEDEGLAGQGCWGVAVDPGYGSAEGFIGVTIRGNRVQNTSNMLIGVAACQDCVIENNIVINNQSYGAIGIAAPDRELGSGDLEQDAVAIRNNSIFMGNGGGTAILLGGQGDEHIAVSNAIHYTGASTSFNCFRFDLDLAAYAAIDNNICHAPESSGAEWVEGYGDLAAWRTASGFDASSSTGDPGFADPATGDLSATSATALMVDSGHPSLSSPIEIGGFPRPQPPDTGAHEYGIEGIFADDFESGSTDEWDFIQQ
jgi:hypothetical protein